MDTQTGQVTAFNTVLQSVQNNNVDVMLGMPIVIGGVVTHWAGPVDRSLGQLEDATVITLPNARALYEELGVARGMVRGNIKIEPLFACLDERSLALVGAHLPARRGAHVTRPVERRT